MKNDVPSNYFFQAFQDFFMFIISLLQVKKFEMRNIMKEEMSNS